MLVINIPVIMTSTATPSSSPRSWWPPSSSSRSPPPSRAPGSEPPAHGCLVLQRPAIYWKIYFFITVLQSVNIFISLPRKQSIYVCENQYTSNLSLNTDLINWLLAHCSIFSIFLYFQLFFRICLFLSILQKFSVFFSIFLACSDLVSML